MTASETERVPENGSEYGTNADTDSDQGINSDNNKQVVKKKTRKRGIVYLSTIPDYMNVAKIRETFSEFGDVGRIFLQPSGSTYFEVMMYLFFPQNFYLFFISERQFLNIWSGCRLMIPSLQ